jgi:hypothetical protein
MLGGFDMRHVVQLGTGSLIALWSYAAQAETISFCPAIEESEVREYLQRAYSEADLVALVKPSSANLLSVRDGTLYDVPVRSVWKGTVGSTIYIDNVSGSFTFATRSGDSGPFESMGECISRYGDIALLDELFGKSYLASDDIRETRFTPLEKAMFLAAAGVGAVILVGFSWALYFVFTSRKGRPRNRMTGG